MIAIILTAGSLVANSQSLCQMKQCSDGVTLCYSLLKSTGFNETMLYNGSFTCKCEKLIFQKNSYNFSTSIIIENSSKITILGNNASINCLKPLSLVFRNIGALRIKHAKIYNCGARIESHNAPVPSCFIFSNIASLKILGVTFTSTPGLAMHGTGLFIVSVLNMISQSQCGNGGVMFTFTSKAQLHNINNTLSESQANFFTVNSLVVHAL